MKTDLGQGPPRPVQNQPGGRLRADQGLIIFHASEFHSESEGNLAYTGYIPPEPFPWPRPPVAPQRLQVAGNSSLEANCR
ncbi:MAG TPA: hypothetical protein DD643_03480 [Synechococcus sp. UBA8638]|nr:hypothetical protein [Synechococcus sp. UBA8638]